MQNHTDRIAPGPVVRDNNSAKVRSVWVQRQSIKVRQGDNDPKVRRIFDLCGCLGC